MLEARYTDMKRFAVHDGPGVRESGLLYFSKGVR